jgi:kynureninase
MKNFEATREYAQSMDAADPLRDFRDRFNLPMSRNGLNCIYLCGNSLGLQPKLAAQFVNEELEDWASLGVEGHLHARRPWLPYHRFATENLADLTGSEHREVVTMNTLTVNLHLLMTTFYRPEGKRRKIVIESTAFPSDRFAVMSQLRLHGHDPEDALIEWVPNKDSNELLKEDLQDILDREGDEIALLLLPGVQYYSGQVLPMQELCSMAHQAGCKIGLDLAHAIGNIPLELHAWGPDFAAWCTYKYLNSGPGAIAGAFVHSRHLDADGTEQLLGWWGHIENTRFRMGPTFTPAQGADLWQLSNPPILSLAPVIASLSIFAEAGIDHLREKSILLTDFMDFLLQKSFSGRIESITPAASRGCQLSLVVRDDALDARAIFDTLEAQNVISDWREPNVIRVAPVPLYNSFEDVFDFADRLQKAVDA